MIHNKEQSGDKRGNDKDAKAVNTLALSQAIASFEEKL